MSITLDATTQAAYEAGTTAAQRAQAVVDGLSGTITVKVFDGSDTEMGSGTLIAPWATASGATVTVGEVASFAVTQSGTPDAGWYLKISDGTHYVQGSFGLSGADFNWSLPSWASGQTGSLGTVTLIATGANEAPAFTVSPTSASLPSTGGTIQFEAEDPNDDTVAYSLASRYSTAITINSATGLVTVPATLAGTSGSITVRASDGTLTADATCAVTVAVMSEAPDAGLSFESFATGLMSVATIPTSYPIWTGEYGGTFTESTTKNSRPTIVSSPTYSGTRAIKCSLPEQPYTASSTDLEKWRSGIEFRSAPEMEKDGGPDPANRAWEGQEVWVGFALMLAADWPHPDDSTYPVKGVGYPAVGCDLHESTKDPKVGSGAFVLQAGNLSYPKEWVVGCDQIGRAPIGDFKLDRGVWTTWVVNIIYSSKGLGRFKVWKNGVVVPNRNLSNITTLASAHRYTPYLKCQTYNFWRAPKPSSAPTYSDFCPEQTAYVDEIRWATGADKYSYVNPQ